jgi:hypothetical protein
VIVIGTFAVPAKVTRSDESVALVLELAGSWTVCTTCVVVVRWLVRVWVLERLVLMVSFLHR